MKLADDIPVCEKTGERCYMNAIELMPGNRLAWRLYTDARSPIGSLLVELEDIPLGEYEAGDLAMKLRVLHDKVAKIEQERAEEAAEHARNETRNRAR